MAFLITPISSCIILIAKCGLINSSKDTNYLKRQELLAVSFFALRPPCFYAVIRRIYFSVTTVQNVMLNFLHVVKSGGQIYS